MYLKDHRIPTFHAYVMLIKLVIFQMGISNSPIVVGLLLIQSVTVNRIVLKI